MKKKIVTLMLTVVLAIAVSACGNTKNTLSTENNIEQSDDTDTAYQNILDDYTQKLKDATPDLIDEFNTEAKEKTGDINSLSEILTSKTEQLAAINTEGIEKMATLMNEKGSDYKIYEKWSTKLNDIYTEQAKLISDTCMAASTGSVSSLNTEEKISIDKDGVDSKKDDEQPKEDNVTSDTINEESFEFDKLQQLYLDIDPNMKYPEVIELIKSTGLHYSEADYLRSKEIQVAFTKGATAQKYKDENGDYITISYVYPDDKDGSIDIEEYLFSVCTYNPCDCSFKLIQYICGSYWSYHDEGNYISDLGTDLDLDKNMSKEEQLEYYFEKKSTAKCHD